MVKENFKENSEAFGNLGLNDLFYLVLQVPSGEECKRACSIYCYNKERSRLEVCIPFFHVASTVFSFIHDSVHISCRHCLQSLKDFAIFSCNKPRDFSIGALRVMATYPSFALYSE